MRRTCSSLVVAAAIAAATVAAADVGGDGYRVRIARTIELEVEATRSASLTLLPAAGRTISRDGPIAITATPAGEGVRLRRQRFGREHAADPAADAPRFELVLTGATPGRHRVGIDIRFWVCAQRTCHPVHESADLWVEVSARPVDAGPSDAGSAR